MLLGTYITLTLSCWGIGGSAQAPSKTAITSVSASIFFKISSIVFLRNISFLAGISIDKSFIPLEIRLAFGVSASRLKTGFLTGLFLTGFILLYCSPFA